MWLTGQITNWYYCAESGSTSPSNGRVLVEVRWASNANANATPTARPRPRPRPRPGSPRAHVPPKNALRELLNEMPHLRVPGWVAVSDRTSFSRRPRYPLDVVLTERDINPSRIEGERTQTGDRGNNVTEPLP